MVRIRPEPGTHWHHRAHTGHELCIHINGERDGKFLCSVFTELQCGLTAIIGEVPIPAAEFENAVFMGYSTPGEAVH